MKIKPRSYPSFDSVKEVAQRICPTLSTALGQHLSVSRRFGSGELKFVVGTQLTVITSDSFNLPAVEKFPFTEQGYQDAQKRFEERLLLIIAAVAEN